MPISHPAKGRQTYNRVPIRMCLARLVATGHCSHIVVKHLDLYLSTEQDLTDTYHIQSAK